MRPMRHERNISVLLFGRCLYLWMRWPRTILTVVHSRWARRQRPTSIACGCGISSADGCSIPKAATLRWLPGGQIRCD